MADLSIYGFKVKTREELIDDLTKELKNSFGATFDVSVSSPDGQIMRIFADALATAYQVALAASNSYNVAATVGSDLDELVRLNGISRILAQPTTVALDLTGTPGTTVPAGSIITTADGLEFTTDIDGLIPAQVQATCSTLGPIEIIAGEVNVIPSPITGWSGATNPYRGTTGILAETDGQLRQRRERTVIRSGTSTIEAIHASVADLELEFISVLVNSSGTTDSFGIPPHSIAVIAEGSTGDLISERIFHNIPAGIQTYGTSSATVTDLVGADHVIQYSRPIDKKVVAEIEFTKDSNVSLESVARMKQALIDYINSTQIAKPLIWSELFPPVLAVAGGARVEMIRVAGFGNTPGILDISVPLDGRIRIDDVDVTMIDNTV